MADPSWILGELQAQIMTVLWRLEAGTVEQVRRALPTRYRGAHTTVQTEVLGDPQELELRRSAAPATPHRASSS